jgi:hypothetical protein
MKYIGIDPGLHGAMALIDGESISTQPIPIITGGKGARDQYALVAIRNWLLMCKKLGGIFVTVEKQQPLPPRFGGGIANYRRGSAMGWIWMLTALAIPYQLVSPRVWQKAMHVGIPGSDTKQRSILAAQQLFPSVDLRRTEKSRKLDDGIADALLLAEFGRRSVSGTKVFARMTKGVELTEVEAVRNLGDATE